MSVRFVSVLVVALGMCMGTALAADDVKSGPQKGDEVPGPFEPLNVTGPTAGKKACLYCRNGEHPVAMVFARELNEPVCTLIKRIDEATGEHKDCKMGSFVVFLSDSDELGRKLKDFADRDNVKNCVLSIHSPEGPKGYNVSRDADVTVVLYAKHQVKANHSFKGELQPKDIDLVLADISTILPRE
jgi:hypothetical protein